MTKTPDTEVDGADEDQVVESPSLEQLVNADLAKQAKPEPQEEADDDTESEDTDDSEQDDAGSDDEGDASESDGDSDEGSDDDASGEASSNEDGQSEVSKWLKDKFVQAGYDEAELEGLSAEELEAELHAFLRRGKPKESINKDDNVFAPPADKPEDESSAKRRQKKLKKLGYDRELEQYVDIVDGVAVAKTEFGSKGMEAATAINDYAVEYRRRTQALLSDPLGTLGEDLDDIIEQRVQKALNSFKGEQQTLTAKQLAERAQAEEFARVEKFKADHKEQIFVITKDGSVRKSLANGQEVMTEYGEKLEKLYLKMKQRSPSALDSDLLNDAVEILGSFAPKADSAENVKAAKAEKQKKFLGDGRKNKATRQVAQSKPASIKERINLGANTSLLQAMLADPENDDNPALANMRQ